MAGALAGLVFVLRFAAHRHHLTVTRRRDAIAQTVEALSGELATGAREDGFALRMATGVRLEAKFVSDSDGPGSTSLVAEESIPTDLVIGAEGVSSRLAKVLTGPDVETGDEFFDHTVLLRGSESRLLAILDRRTRQLVLAAVTQGTTVSDGRVSAVVQGEIADSVRLILPSRELTTLAHAISERASQPVAALLRENAMGDSIPSVRRRNLERLVEQFPEHPETRVALEAASVDADPSVRLFAAARLTGGASTEALSYLVSDPHLEDSVRVDALQQLLAARTGARTLVVIERALADRSAAIRAIAISAIGKARRTTSVGTLLALAAKATDPAEQLALCEAFWRLRDPAAEGVLLRLLEIGGTSVRTAAARALGRTGGVGAVEPLRGVQGLFAGELGQAAGEAVTAIQARLRNASEGQLSVSDAPDGQGHVSLSTGGGAVSIHSADRRRR